MVYWIQVVCMAIVFSFLHHQLKLALKIIQSRRANPKPDPNKECQGERAHCMHDEGYKYIVTPDHGGVERFCHIDQCCQCSYISVRPGTISGKR